MRHEWQTEGRRFEIHSSGALAEWRSFASVGISLGWHHIDPGPVMGIIAREILRLAERVRELEGAQLSAEEGQEIIAELSAALAVQCGEELKPCAAGCPGHLGDRAAAIFRDALGRYTALKEENRRLREEPLSPGEFQLVPELPTITALPDLSPYSGREIWSGLSDDQRNEILRLLTLKDVLPDCSAREIYGALTPTQRSMLGLRSDPSEDGEGKQHHGPDSL